MKLFSTKDRSRTKSENDASKRTSIDQDDKKKLSTTSSNFALEETSDGRLSRRSSQLQHYNQHQSNDKVNNSNPIIYRDQNNRRYSNPFFTSNRLGPGRASIVGLPANYPQKLETSRSVDRLHHHRPSRREIRYEEHDDYIPPPSIQSIKCHPTIENYSKNLNTSSYFSSNHRRSQIEAYQLSSTNNRITLPKPYSTSIPYSQSEQIMSKISSDNNNNKNHKNHTYGLLSECHTPSPSLENTSIKAPRRIESNYSQFPLQQEPIYANTQSLYDNILFPQSASRSLNRLNDQQERKSCASQTQLTWTMATFSSFVDLENQSVVVPQPEPNTLYSVVQHHQTYPPPSASSETIEHMRRTSPNLNYIDDSNSSSHYQRPRSPMSSTTILVEKRDGSFQTLLSIAPTQDINSNKQLFVHETSPSPQSNDSSGRQQRHHHHHHHHHNRKHKSRTSSSNNVSTRDVGLQVNIQTVKKITFTSQKSDESSLTTSATTPSSPPTMKTSRELKNVETNTEPLVTKRDISTSYESSLHLITSSSQTTESSSSTATTTSSTNQQTKAAQTSTKTLRDQSSETNTPGLFVCDLSSLLTNGTDEPSASNIK